MAAFKQNGVTQRIKNDCEDKLKDFNHKSKQLDTPSNPVQLIRPSTASNGTPHSLPREMVPKVMWEPCILTGYRPAHQPWIYYIKSLFWIHNETVNIWTHLLSPIFSLLLVNRLKEDVDFSSNISSHGLLVSVVAANGLFIVSTSAHMFRNRSEMTQNILMCLDYSGVGLFLYGQYIMLYYCSGNELFYKTVGTTFPTILTICALNVVVCHVMARTLYKTGSKGRKLLQLSSIALIGFTGHLPLMFRLHDCMMENSCLTESSNLYHAYAFVIFTPLAGLSFSFHLPERVFPGKFDIWGHGHQWFHLAATCTLIAGLYASCIDLLTIPKDVLELAEPNSITIWRNLFFFLTLNASIFITTSFIYVFKNQ